MSLELSPPVFSILRTFVEEKTGIHHAEGDREMFLAKIAPRVQEAGFQSLLDYYYFLRYDPQGHIELETLIEHLVVRETYLFRELQQLRAVVQSWVAPKANRGEKLRIWSAACSTGDEPLSLMLLLAQAGLLDSVDLVASDLSRQALEVAQKGRFGRRSLRALAPGMDFNRWLARNADGSVTADPALLRQVSWRRINLIEKAQVQALGAFDIIFCRNVLIYFNDETTRAVVESLAGALRPGGILVVSVTESLMRYGTSLSCEEHGGVFVYRKALS